MDRKAFYEKTRTIVEILRLVFMLLAVSVVTISIIKYVWQSIGIEGDSMLPTFKNGDKILILKVGNKAEYDRYDIIVFKPYEKDKEGTADNEENVLYIKRIIGLPGETLRIDTDGVVYVMDADGGFRALEGDRYGSSPSTRGINWNLNDSDYYETVTLGNDEYFVLGDNRSVSLDSRSEQVRAVNVNCVIGKYVLGIRPFGKK